MKNKKFSSPSTTQSFNMKCNRKKKKKWGKNNIKRLREENLNRLVIRIEYIKRVKDGAWIVRKKCA